MNPLKLIVCIKTVALKAPDRQGCIPREAYALNPFDLPALAAALDLKERCSGKVTALSMGPPWATAALHEALALGVDRVILLSDPALAGSDTLATATALSAAIQRLSPWDLLIFGSRTADGDTGHVGPQTAWGLGLALLGGVTQISLETDGLQAERTADGLLEHYQMGFPGALSVHPDGWPPREISLMGIEASYGGGIIETWGLDDIQVNSAQVGEAGSPTRVFRTRSLTREKRCAFIEGPPAQQAERLVRHLQELGLVE